MWGQECCRRRCWITYNHETPPEQHTERIQLEKCVIGSSACGRSVQREIPKVLRGKRDGCERRIHQRESEAVQQADLTARWPSLFEPGNRPAKWCRSRSCRYRSFAPQAFRLYRSLPTARFVRGQLETSIASRSTWAFIAILLRSRVAEKAVPGPGLYEARRCQLNPKPARSSPLRQRSRARDGGRESSVPSVRRRITASGRE